MPAAVGQREGEGWIWGQRGLDTNRGKHSGAAKGIGKKRPESKVVLRSPAIPSPSCLGWTLTYAFQSEGRRPGGSGLHGEEIPADA